MTRPLPLRILASGEYRPRHRVESTDFDRRWQRPPGWTQASSGVASRGVAADDEPASLMGARAAQIALQRAGLAATDIDAVVCATGVGEQSIPCTAVLVHRHLGLQRSGIPAWDIDATCLGFLVALDHAAMAIAAGRYRRVLIVATEVPTAGLDPDDTDTAPLFGDGAAAVIVDGGDGRSALLSARLETWSDGADLCQVRAGGTRLRPHVDLDAFMAGTRFRMNGRATYRLASRLLPGFLHRLFDGTGVGLGDLAAFVPHQASGKALDHIESAIGLPAAAVIRTLHDHGNQMAASIPVALNHALECGRVKAGDYVALVGTGAGLSFGGAVLRW